MDNHRIFYQTSNYPLYLKLIFAQFLPDQISILYGLLTLLLHLAQSLYHKIVILDSFLWHSQETNQFRCKNLPPYHLKSEESHLPAL